MQLSLSGNKILKYLGLKKNRLVESRFFTNNDFTYYGTYIFLPGLQPAAEDEKYSAASPLLQDTGRAFSYSV